MSDIVERLRDRNNPENRRMMMTEAADEIERLEKHNAELRAALDLITHYTGNRRGMIGIAAAALAGKPWIGQP